jgi:subtilisin family serine protease
MMNLNNPNQSAAGTGTVLYVVDSGVMAAHGDFGGRVVMRGDFLSAETREDRARTSEMGGDCYGHGTAVASLAAGRYSGMAGALYNPAS